MSPLLSLLFIFSIIVRLYKIQCTTFTFINKCDSTIWPATLTNAGIPTLNPTGFELRPAQTRSVEAPAGWSGRFWARTGCDFDQTGHGSCSTGDCGSGQIECNGSGATPPATLAEFTLVGPGSTKDFYDVSLVDGYNLPMVVESGWVGCGATGCLVDLNRRCPVELRVGNGEACRSACEAFRKPEFCCSGAYANPNTCHPTFYSQVFKSACPKSYSYAYDDATSIFTCGGGDYTVTFCPDSTASLKSTRPDPPSNDTQPKTTTGEGGWGYDSWLASLETGGAPSVAVKGHHFLQQVSLSLVPITFACILLILQVL